MPEKSKGFVLRKVNAMFSFYNSFKRFLGVYPSTLLIALLLAVGCSGGGSSRAGGAAQSTATNVNPEVTVDDGSSTQVIEGFTLQSKNIQGLPEYTHDETGIEFVLVPGGEFEMGSPENEEGRRSTEGPVHTVTLSPFLIAKYEVTQAQYKAVMTGNTADLSPTPSYAEGDNRPVEGVSWIDLKAADGFLGRTGLSLPSEAQWEYACRAGSTGPYAGDGIPDDMGWYSSNSGKVTHNGGGKQANDFGLHDMHGNVFEWCEDVYNGNFYDSEFAYGPDPVATSGSVSRVIRGGAFPYFALLARSADRRSNNPSRRFNYIGFRPVMPLP